MLVRLVQVRTRKDGSLSRRAERKDLPSLVIGRASDCGVVLRELDVGLRHLEITETSDAIRVRGLGANAIRLNGKEIREGSSVDLVVGDRIRLGSYELRVAPPEEGERLCLEMEVVVRRGSEREELGRRTRLGFESASSWMRPLSWLGFAGVLFVFLLMPILTGWFEGSWSTGQVSSGHAFFASDCRSCHTDAFTQVQDESCLSCHPGVGEHAARSVELRALVETRCATCHLEHNGPQGLSALEQRACSDCHSDLKRTFAETPLPDVSDFGRAHPQFRLSMLRASEADGEEAAIARVEWSPEVREESGLIFNHLRHVGQPVKDVQTGETRHMQCGECHSPNGAGTYMQPVVFEEHCQSCHGLGFDEATPSEQALHGPPEMMREGLTRYYESLALRSDEGAGGGTVLQRRRPGSALTAPERLAAIQWAHEQVARADDFLGEEACTYCHLRAPEPASDGGFDLAPVQVSEVWLPFGGFSHAPHAPFACADCHPAAAVFDPEKKSGPWPEWAKQGPEVLMTPMELSSRHGKEPSSSAEDVMIPGIETCRDCHAGARAGIDEIASDCVTCHPFHRSEHGRILDRHAKLGFPDFIHPRNSQPSTAGMGAFSSTGPRREVR